VRARAISEADRIIARTGHLPIERIAAAVVDAVEPIIRADVDARWHVEMIEWRKEVEAVARERIAQEIEAEWAHFMRVTSTDEHHWLGRVYADVARIARGGAQ
jgi:hypothetical protein